MAQCRDCRRLCLVHTDGRCCHCRAALLDSRTARCPLNHERPPPAEVDPTRAVRLALLARLATLQQPLFGERERLPGSGEGVRGRSLSRVIEGRG